MLNLIKRDVILQKRQLLFYIPFIVFFILMGAPPVLIFLVASIFIPFNTYAYDEKVETNILLNSLPYTRTEIIASRYLGAIAYMILSIGVTSLALLAFNKHFTMADIAIGSGLFLLFAALTFPLFQIFKQGYITTVILISFILLTWISRPIALYMNEHLTAIIDFVDNTSVTVLYTGATLFIMLIYIISLGITHSIYQRKAF